MESGGLLFEGLGVVMHEAALFAACGFLFMGFSDVIVDLIWIARTGWRRLTVYRRFEPAKADTLEQARSPGRLAVFIPAGEESGVIGPMLRHTLATFRHGDYRLYVGCYPNDPDTIAAVREVEDPRVRLVIGPLDGPTTKADCLNRLWTAMMADEAAEGRRVKAVILHDAEDVVHEAELRIFDRLIERFDLVQLPVLPLIDPNSRWIAGHYIDEFAEAHAKELVVREAVGAGLPSAGVGCAFSREMLAEIAKRSGAAPFDAASLTEDYELGLKIRLAGGRPAFVRLRESEGGPLVATREYFPGTVEGAVAQKARWMTGIALSGWDRLGWSGGVAERWMRLRDRRSVLAALCLVAAYVALLLWALLSLRHIFLGIPPRPTPPLLEALLALSFVLLAWRLVLRFAFVTQAYGWREGLRSVPRVVVANAIAMLAARRAVMRYVSARKRGEPRWDKTDHAFPVLLRR